MKSKGAPLVLLWAVMLFVGINTSAQELKVMTFNIYHGEIEGTPGKSNLLQVADLIKKHQPDFVALQEADSMTNRSASLNNGIRQNLVQALAGLTGMYGYFGKAIDYEGGGYGIGILSRWPKISEKINLPDPEGGEKRALLLVEHTFGNGRKILFGATHFCHQSEKNQIAQAETVCNLLTQTAHPVIIGGDFNIVANSKAYSFIRQHYIDAAAHYGNPQNTIPSNNPRSRIDYIFASKAHPWRVKDVQVLSSNASDHLPVLVTIELLNPTLIEKSNLAKELTYRGDFLNCTRWSDALGENYLILSQSKILKSAKALEARDDFHKASRALAHH